MDQSHLITCVLFTKFIKSSNFIFKIYYILQYLHSDVKRDLVHNIHGTVMYISYYDYVLRLKMVFIAETCCL